MKQKAVLRVTLKDPRCRKCRSKALKVVVGAHGVEFVGWKGSERDELEVVGDGLDIVQLVESIRKKVGTTEVVSINPVKPDSGGGANKPTAPSATSPAGAPIFVLPPCVPTYVEMPRGYIYAEPVPSCSIL